MSKERRDSNGEKKEGKTRKLSGEDLLEWLDEIKNEQETSFDVNVWRDHDEKVYNAIRAMIKQDEQNQDAESGSKLRCVRCEGPLGPRSAFCADCALPPEVKASSIFVNKYGEAAGVVVDSVVCDIEKIMQYRGQGVEEGKLRVILSELIQSQAEPDICYACGKEIKGEKVCRVRAFHPECSYKWVADKPGRGEDIAMEIHKASYWEAGREDGITGNWKIGAKGHSISIELAQTFVNQLLQAQPDTQEVK